MRTPLKFFVAAAATLTLAAPAFAQDATTLQNVTTKGSVMKADMQGTPVELPMTYKADGTYATSAMGQDITGKWRIDGDKLCTLNSMNPSETCIAYPAGKKPGDEFTVEHPMFGSVTVKINQ
jgi:hypothetical protein